MARMSRAASALASRVGAGIVCAGTWMAKGCGMYRRLWRRLARAPEAVAGCPVDRPFPGSAELPSAVRRALRRRRSRAGALPRVFDQNLDHTAAR
eukprot:scaffold71126_cov57-Phaeocystis_antarctica.AAC.4